MNLCAEPAQAAPAAGGKGLGEGEKGAPAGASLPVKMFACAHLPRHARPPGTTTLLQPLALVFGFSALFEAVMGPCDSHATAVLVR